MAASVIRVKLDLLVHLFDTTTGATVEERQVTFMRDGIPARAEARGAGNFVFINTGREDFLMHIEVYGYKPCDIFVKYENMSEVLPTCNAFLMPSENTSKGMELISFSGTLPFLKTIEAVNLNKSICMTGDLNKRTNTMTVFNPNGGRLRLDESIYGLLSADKKFYERIEVEKVISDQSVKLKSLIERDFSPNLPIARIVYGIVNEKGNYLIKVIDDGEDKDTRYLVRYEVGEEVRFQEVDFKNQEDLT